MLVTSQYLKSLYSESGIRSDYPCGTLKQTSKENIMLKHVRIITAGEAAFGAITLRLKFGTFS